MKNIIFVSDLHLGVGRANDFHENFHFHRLLDYAAENCDEFVILGDFLELLQCEFLAIYSAHHDIFRHLFALAEKIPVKIIPGNHDAALVVDYDPRGDSHFLGSKISVAPEFENRELGIFAAHGHQFSLANRREKFDSDEITFGDRIAKIVGWLEKNVHPRIDNFAEKIYLEYKKFLRRISHDSKNFADLVNPSHPDYRKLGGDFTEYERGARAMLASERYSLVIFGHTHVQKITEFENGIYANCGSWVGDSPAAPPVFLDVDENFVRLINARTFKILANVARTKKSAPKISPQKMAKRKVFV